MEIENFLEIDPYSFTIRNTSPFSYGEGGDAW
jgi:hypothetical protein